MPRSSNDRVLLLLVLADFVLAMLTIAAEVALHWTLPRPLRDHVISPWVLPLFPVWVLMVVMTVTSWIGLLNYWRTARTLYLAAWGIWLFLTVASGPSVMTAVGGTLSTLEALVGGAILGLVYFSDLSESFTVSDEETSDLPIEPLIR